MQKMFACSLPAASDIVYFDDSLPDISMVMIKEVVSYIIAKLYLRNR